jgi:hypothetical protein
MQILSALLLALCLFVSFGTVYRIMADTIRHVKTGGATTDRTLMLVIACVLWGIYIHLL